jgi:hypothetical protein
MSFVLKYSMFLWVYKYKTHTQCFYDCMSTNLILKVFMSVWVQHSYSMFLWLYEYKTHTQCFMSVRVQNTYSMFYECTSTKLILNVFMTVWVQNSYSKFLWQYEYKTHTQSFYWVCVLYSYSHENIEYEFCTHTKKNIQSECHILLIKCSDWTIFEYMYEICIQ